MIKPKSYYFAFTMSKNSGVKTLKSANSTFEEYEYYLNNLKTLNKTTVKRIDYHFENKYKGNGRWNLHVHAMIKTYKFRDRPPLRHTLKRGYQIKIDKVWCKTGWRAYITKDAEHGSKAFILDEIYANIFDIKDTSDLPSSYKAKAAEAGRGFDEPDEPSTEEGVPTGEGALCAAQGDESKPTTSGAHPDRLNISWE